MALTFHAVAPLDAEAVLPIALVEQLIKPASNADAQLIASHRVTALAWVERYSGRSLARRAWRAVYDRIPDRMMIPVGPVVSVTSVTLMDGTIERDAVGLWCEAGGVIVSTGRWPNDARCVSIDFVAGWADLTGEGAPLLTAALMLVKHLYDGGGTDDVPTSVTMLCDMLRMPVVA